MKVLVTGGRDFKDSPTVFAALDAIHARTPVRVVIHGGAAGADASAQAWAEDLGIAVYALPADWARFGRSAGPIRNGKLLDLRPSLVVAFPGGRGTADCVRQARARKIPVHEVSV